MDSDLLSIKFTLTYKQFSETFELELDNLTAERLILLFFSNEEQLNPILKKSTELNKSIILFCSQIKDKYPKINGVEAFIRRIKRDDYFCMMPSQFSNEKMVYWFERYFAIENNQTYEEYVKESRAIYGDITDSYYTFTYGLSRTSIGESQKKKRVCRFCGRNIEQTRFNNKAHAIPEALGNKTIICNEECDECNLKFGGTIERALIFHFEPYLAFSKIKGKGNNKKVKGEGFYITRTGVESDVTLFVENTTNKPVKELLHQGNLNLVFKRKYAHQDVYRALCKIVLSIIPEGNLNFFNKTKDWINGKYDNNKLPLVAVRNYIGDAFKQPNLSLYIRKDHREDIPFVFAELKFMSFNLTFIVPSFNDIEADFSDKNAYQKFKDVFPPFKYFNQWVYEDLQDNNFVERETLINPRLSK